MESLYLLLAVAAAYLIYEVIRSIIKIVTLITKILVSFLLLGLLLIVLNSHGKLNLDSTVDEGEHLLLNDTSSVDGTRFNDYQAP